MYVEASSKSIDDRCLHSCTVSVHCLISSLVSGLKLLDLQYYNFLIEDMGSHLFYSFLLLQMQDLNTYGVDLALIWCSTSDGVHDIT